MRLFDYGQIYFTRAVNNKMVEDMRFEAFCLGSLKRHIQGDWGDLNSEDKKENELSLEKGFRLFSSYKCEKESIKIWIITERDRSIATILFPEDY